MIWFPNLYSMQTCAHQKYPCAIIDVNHQVIFRAEVFYPQIKRTSIILVTVGFCHILYIYIYIYTDIDFLWRQVLWVPRNRKEVAGVSYLGLLIGVPWQLGSILPLYVIKRSLPPYILPRHIFRWRTCGFKR